MPSMSQNESSLKERGAERIKQWHLRKELLEKGLELFSKIDSCRAEDEESLKEAAICAAAVDRMVGETEPSRQVPQEERKKMGKKKTMKAAWQRWAMENHSFSNIELTEAEVAEYSGGFKEMLDKPPGAENYTLLSLKYNFPGVPKPGEKAKPITNDQRLQNMVFMKECGRVWREAKEELRLRVLESVSRAQQRALKTAAGKNQVMTDPDAVASAAERSCLTSLSVKRLKQWVEDDEDKKAEKLREEKAEKIQMSKISHEQFVKHKDGLRIRLPPSEFDPHTVAGRRPRPKSAGPRMSFGGAVSGVRRKEDAAPQTTVDLMMGTGLKYVHATHKGRQGMEGDLEKSRKQLLQKGFVAKDNFDTDPDSEYNTEAFRKMVKNNPTVRELKEQQEKAAEDSARAYEEWSVLKANKEQAVRYLGLVPSPEPESRPHSDTQAYGEIAQPLCSLSHDALQDCIEIGELLKKVDRTLFSEWFRWSNSHSRLEGTDRKAISFSFATALWDYFEPKACDVHSAISSQVRETFMKLLRPGLDFKAAFKTFAEKRWNRMRARSEYELDEEEKEKMVASIALGRRDMQRLLIDMGVSMKKNEVNALIDAFDSNGDGVVTMSEFLEFTGPMRNNNSGALATIKRKCCWRTTCKKTGMNNAYAVSEPTKEQLRKEGKNVLDDRGSCDGSVRGSTEKRGGEKTEIIKLKNGESRVRVELAERKRREDMLKRYRVLREEEGKQQDDDEDDGYGSDFDNEDPEGGNGKDKKDTTPSCPYSTWTLADRKRALKRLADITRDARAEEQLKTLISEGTPPSAPRLWGAGLTDEEVDEEDANALTRSVLLRWGPGDPNSDLVSFYSLEYAGVVKMNATGERRYNEIYRDPQDADIHARFALKYWMDDLEPGCSYAFRIRGFNGFGPGPFTYKVVTTRPAAPAPPRVINCAHDAVTLRWVFSNTFMQQLQQLKKLFELADTDGSGAVSREELCLIFQDHEASNPDLMKMVRKVLVRKGLNPSTGINGLFDQIEGDDDNVLSWDEFEKYFISAGFTSDSIAISKSFGDGMRASAVSTGGGMGGGASKASSHAQVSYVIEQCESELTNVYKECMKSQAGQCTVSRLMAGHTYRFRVHGVNVDGESGPSSESVIVHTMVETPAPPVLYAKGELGSTATVSTGAIGADLTSSTAIFPTKIVLRWKGRRDGASSRDKGVIDRMLGDWAGVGAEDGGVSIETAFANYDRDRNGTIEPSEFEYLLKDLGVEVSAERINEAFAVFDTDGDGVISFDEFSRWWRKDEVSYTIKRSDEIPPTLPVSLGATAPTEQSRVRSIAGRDGGVRGSQSLTGLSARSKTPMRMSREKTARVSREKTATIKGDETANIDVPLPVVSYRGTSRHTEIAGLQPNSLYHFRLRYVGSRSNSALSTPLVVMTTPLACDPPTLIYLAPNSVRIKWYPPEHGAHKFCVQLKNLSPSRGDDEFTTVFVGQENLWVATTLVPDNMYAVRVVGVNQQGVMGPPSAPLTFRTFPRNETKHIFSARSANSTFSIECTGDVCVGDTILLTERLYAKASRRAQGADDEVDSGSVGGRSRASRGARSKGGGVDGGSSVYSLTATGKGGRLLTGDAPEAGSFIGERTLAAHVVKDNYKSARVSFGSKDLQPGKFSRVRRLWLEVVWQKSSNESCKPYELKPGEVVERSQSHIEQFEVFRCPWIHEESRKSLREDMKLLAECFLQHPC